MGFFSIADEFSGIRASDIRDRQRVQRAFLLERVSKHGSKGQTEMEFNGLVDILTNREGHGMTGLISVPRLSV